MELEISPEDLVEVSSTAEISPGPLTILSVSPLSIEELGDYIQEKKKDTKGDYVETMRQRHHAVARMDACGYSGVEIAHITGYTKVHIYNLQKAPAYIELREFYSEQVLDRAFDFKAQMDWLQELVTDRLREKLEDENATPEFVRQSFQTILDRNGMGPSSNLKVRAEIAVLTGDDLLAMKKRVNDGDKGLVE